MTTMRIDSINVADRHRKDAGDIGPLAESIERLGLLHPIVVTPGGDLIAGFRRHVACATLGWGDIPVTIAASLEDARARLEAERDENTCRLDMSPSEKVSLGRALEQLERPRARERQRGGPKKASGNFTEAGNVGGSVRDIVGEAVGMSGVTYARAKRVVDAAERGERNGAAALEQMDATGKVLPAYERVKGTRGKPEDGRRRPTPPNPSTGRGRTQAMKNRQRVVDLVSHVHGRALVADAIEIEHIYAVGDANELHQLIEQFGSDLKTLTAWKRKLERSRQ